MKNHHLNRKIGGSLLALSLMLGVIGCTAPASRSADPLPTASQPNSSLVAQPSIDGRISRPASKPMNPKLIAAQTRFSWNLFSTIHKKNPQKNLFISPISISQAIAMIYNGAAVETQTAIGSALALEDLSLDDFNSANEDLRNALEYPGKDIQLSIANSIWTNQDTPISPNFIRRNQQFYNAKVESLDFNNKKSIGIINNWVKRNTQGKIDGIVDQLSEADRLILVNATYFKGEWSSPFTLDQTTPQDFSAPDGKKTVPMMAKRGTFRYFEREGLQAVALPYGDRRLNLYVFLPKNGQTLDTVIQTLTPKTWSQWMSEFRTVPGYLQLPRFKMESKLELQNPLSELGMGIAFSDKANFSSLSTRPVQIDQVIHKTFVEVNESGTTAAAATAIGIRSTSVEEVKMPFDMKVNQPFLCVLRDDQTGAILFMGAINNP